MFGMSPFFIAMAAEANGDIGKLPKLLDHTMMMFEEEYNGYPSSFQKQKLIKDIFSFWNKTMDLMESLREETPEVRVNSINQIVDGFFQNTANKASCKRGCSSCCHLNVDITDCEAQVIKKFPHNKKNLKLHSKLGQATRHKLSREESACPFLKDNECSIYEDRPLACRAYHVVSDPKLCDIHENPDGKAGVMIVSTVDFIRAANYHVYGCKTMADHLLAE